MSNESRGQYELDYVNSMTLPKRLRQILSWPKYGGSFSPSPVEQLCFDLITKELPEQEKITLSHQVKSIFRIQHWIKGRMTHISLDPAARVEPFSDIPEEHCLASIQYVEKESRRRRKVLITCYRGKLNTIEGAIPADIAQLDGCKVTLHPKVKLTTARALDRLEHGKDSE